MRFPSFFTNRKRSVSELRNAIESEVNHRRYHKPSASNLNPRSHLAATRRISSIERMEARTLFNVDPIWVGGVYIEEDQGSDLHGDSFYISFTGGADGTTLKQIVIDGDQGTAGFNVGDNFFDTEESGLVRTTRIRSRSFDLQQQIQMLKSLRRLSMVQRSWFSISRTFGQAMFSSLRSTSMKSNSTIRLKPTWPQSTPALTQSLPALNSKQAPLKHTLQRLIIRISTAQPLIGICTTQS